MGPEIWGGGLGIRGPRGVTLTLDSEDVLEHLEIEHSAHERDELKGNPRRCRRPWGGVGEQPSSGDTQAASSQLPGVSHQFQIIEKVAAMREASEECYRPVS